MGSWDDRILLGHMGKLEETQYMVATEKKKKRALRVALQCERGLEWTRYGLSRSTPVSPAGDAQEREGAIRREKSSLHYCYPTPFETIKAPCSQRSKSSDTTRDSNPFCWRLSKHWL